MPSWALAARALVAIALAGLGGLAPPMAHARSAARPTPLPLLSKAGGAPCTRSARRGDRTDTVLVDGERRQMLVHVPRGTRPGRELPLLLALHGFRSNGRKMEPYTGFSALADRRNFVVAYPSALLGRWRIHASDLGSMRDLDFMRVAIARIKSALCVDPGRVFVAGVSNGGGEAARIGCALSDLLDGIATVAGDYRHQSACLPARPLSLLEIHGGRDPVVPYFGRPPDGDGGVPAFLARWRAIDRCPSRGARRRPAAGMTITAWRCPQGIRVRHLRVDALGHAWPGASPRPGRLPGRASAARQIWDFFSTLPSRPVGEPRHPWRDPLTGRARREHPDGVARGVG